MSPEPISSASKHTRKKSKRHHASLKYPIGPSPAISARTRSKS